MDEVAEKYIPVQFLASYLRKEIMIQPNNTSYVIEYAYEGKDEGIINFYRELIPDCNEEVRNDVTYIQDNIVGTDLAQYITIDNDYNRVTVDEITYQKD